MLALRHPIAKQPTQEVQPLQQQGVAREVVWRIVSMPHIRSAFQFVVKFAANDGLIFVLVTRLSARYSVIRAPATLALVGVVLPGIGHYQPSASRLPTNNGAGKVTPCSAVVTQNACCGGSGANALWRAYSS